jgi:hypothetical protein
VFNQN